MNENENKTGSWKMILGGIVLIVVLYLCIKFVFWGLGEVIYRDVPDVSQSASVSQSIPVDGSEEDAPSFCVHCGKELPEHFRWGQFCPYCGEQIEQ